MKRLMTLANKITVARICLIPIFAASAWGYSLSVLRSAPTEGLRILATLTFSLAALTDGIDGFIARRWNQRSRLGAVLDPIADKGLMFAAMIVLSQSGWHPSLPGFFPCVVIGRDLFLGIGFFLLTRRIGHVEVRPSWTGKATTASQMVCILWVLLQIKAGLMVAIVLATVMTIASGVCYLFDGLRQERVWRA
jgi:cardiolipin synthase (CMP-forming)